MTSIFESIHSDDNMSIYTRVCLIYATNIFKLIVAICKCESEIYDQDNRYYSIKNTLEKCRFFK